ncbi:T9SS type A sorting domain-containing protein, partial [candidate division WOR-3 bacterium]|nr:T9SS type A sorting domain-containing protein [candidate division WOR-3 bacterium]
LLVEIVWNGAGPGGSIASRNGSRSPARRTWAWDWEGTTGVMADAYLYNARFLFADNDVGCTHVLAPTGTVDSGRTVTPACSVYNFGGTTETYDVRMRIGSTYAEAVNVAGHAPGTSRYVEFPGWQADVRGRVAVSCSTELVGDANDANDRTLDSAFVQVLDAAAVSITEPAGTYTLGASITPAATWRNNGNRPASFHAWMCLNDPTDGRVYAQRMDVTNLLPGATMFINTFPSFVLNRGGAWTARCSTWQAGDMRLLNNVINQGFTVGSPDVGVAAVLSPPAWVDTGAPITPRARAHNYGDCVCDFTTWFDIFDSLGASIYGRTFDVTGLGVGADTVLTYPVCAALPIGSYTYVCSTYTPGDAGPGNDAVHGAFRVATAPPSYGWREMAPLPPGTKPVKDGGWLAIAEEGGTVYAAKGNKVGDFCAYYAAGDSWVTLPSIPNGPESKPPYKGAVGVCDDAGRIYAVKGNNTLAFWRYHIDSMAWTNMPDIPLGPSGKKVKGGTDVVYAVEGDTGFVYLLKGYKQEFFRFNTVSGVWDTTLPPAPAGANPKWGSGSWLALEIREQPHAIWAHKAKYHEMWRFDMATHTWAPGPQPGMPLVGSSGKSKKSKDGSCAAYYAGGIYTLKSGNTQEFWKYVISTGTWVELETIPAFGSTAKKKRVKSGANIVPFGGCVFYATKGNKTLEFWRYTGAGEVAAAGPERSGVTGQRLSAVRQDLAVVPNPTSSGAATLRYSLPEAGPATVRVFDITGRSVLTQALSTGRGASGVSLDLRGLSAGVYLLTFEAGGWRQSRKLVVE